MAGVIGVAQIDFPIDRILADVVANDLQFLSVPDNVLVVVALPVFRLPRWIVCLYSVEVHLEHQRLERAYHIAQRGDKIRPLRNRNDPRAFGWGRDCPCPNRRVGANPCGCPYSNQVACSGFRRSAAIPWNTWRGWLTLILSANSANVPPSANAAWNLARSSSR